MRMQNGTTQTELDLAMTYSAYREMEFVPRKTVDRVSEAILSLAENPRPDDSYMIEDARGCYYLPVGDWYILYHLSENRDSLTVLGVLDGPEHTVH